MRNQSLLLRDGIVRKWNLVRCRLSLLLSSATFQLAVPILLFGVGLYVVDVCSDLYSVHNMFLLRESSGSADIGTDPKIWAWLTLAIIALPGLFRAAQSLCQRRFDLGLGEDGPGGTRITKKNCCLVPIYLLAMPVWGVFIPLLHYLKLSIHLWREIREECAYDPRLLQKAIEAKTLEGLAEAAPQLLLQAYLLSAALLYENGPDVVFGMTDEDFYKRQLPLQCLQLSSSFISFLKTLSDGVEYFVIANVGRIKSTSACHRILFLLFACFTFVHRLLFGGLMAFWYQHNWHNFTFSHWSGVFIIASVALVLFLPILNVIIHWKSFGSRPSNLVDGLLSSIVPFNFIDRDFRKTRCYLTWYNLANESVFFLSALLFAVSYYLQYEEYRSYTQFECLAISLVQLLLYAFAKLGQVLYCHLALFPLYRTKDICHPGKIGIGSRRKTFPWNWSDLCKAVSTEELVNVGHFFSDHRKTKPRTTCFSCGFSREWQCDTNISCIHFDFCVFEHTEKVVEQKQETQEEVQIKRVILKFVKLVFDKALSTCLIVHLLWLTFSFEWDFDKWWEEKNKIWFLRMEQHVQLWPAVVLCTVGLLFYWAMGQLFLQHLFLQGEGSRISRDLKVALSNVTFQSKGEEQEQAGLSDDA